MRRARHLMGIVVLLLPAAGAAQENASVDRVEALMAQGKIPQAREVLEEWWEARGPRVGRLERQRSLWLRARLTVDPSLAELDLRRLVLEFPGGPFSDDALLRLAQSAEARGDLQGAFRHYAALARGYPSSPHTPGAREWVERHRADLVVEEAPEADRGVAPVDSGVRADAMTPEAEGDFAVQLGAFRELENARALADKLQGAGFEPRIVRLPGDDLARVRAGRFQVRDGADELRRTLQAAGFEATIVTDARVEERVR